MEDTGKILEFVRLGGVLSSALLLFATWVVARLLARFVDQAGARFSHRRLLIQQVGTFVRFGLYLGAMRLSVLLSFSLSKEMVLALAGTAAVTVGFALKDLASSIIAGLTILIDRPFQVGDRVSFGEHYGEIRSIGLRSVRLVTLDDNVVTIPNNKFLTEVVASGNDGELNMLIQLDFYIGADMPVAPAHQIVADALTSSHYAYLKKPWVVLVNQMVHEGYFTTRLRAKVYVLDVRYEKALETDVTQRVIDGFRAAGIGPPARLYRVVPGAEALLAPDREAGTGAAPGASA
jgi:small-conductance mechanosensitive channel